MPSSPAICGEAFFLTHTTPLPLVSGERIRNYHLLRQLAGRGWRLRLFSLVHGTFPTPDEVRTLETLCDELILEPFDVTPGVRYARIVRNLATLRAFHTDFFFSRPAAARLRDRLRESRPDVVVVAQLYMYPYIYRGLHSRAVLDSHNLESRRVRGMAAALGISPRGLVARLQARPVETFQAQAVQAVARTIAVSPEEAAYFEQLAPERVAVVPNGVDCEGLRPRAELPREPRVLFVGSMDYSANVDAVRYLVDDVLPHLRRTDVTVTLVGNNPRPAVYRAARRAALRVEVVGRVETTQPYYERSRLLVVPLRYAGGTRLKILEALAHGVPVVSTTIGCEGLGLRNRRDIVIEDDPVGLAASIEELLEDDDLCHTLAREGRATVESRYDWGVLAGDFDRVLKSVVEGND